MPKINIPGVGSLDIKVEAIAIDKKEMGEKNTWSIREAVQDVTKSPEEENFLMIPLAGAPFPFADFADAVIEEHSKKFEVYKDADTIYIVNGAIGREKLLKLLASQEDDLKEYIAQLQFTATQIARGQTAGKN